MGEARTDRDMSEYALCYTIPKCMVIQRVANLTRARAWMSSLVAPPTGPRDTSCLVRYSRRMTEK
jgi:hypothetical protein